MTEPETQNLLSTEEMLALVERIKIWDHALVGGSLDDDDPSGNDGFAGIVDRLYVKLIRTPRFIVFPAGYLVEVNDHSNTDGARGWNNIVFLGRSPLYDSKKVQPYYEAVKSAYVRKEVASKRQARNDALIKVRRSFVEPILQE